jgi:predicted nucleic acid-binding protein
MPKILLDTNIIIDFFEEGRDHNKPVTELIEKAIFADYQLNVVATTCKDAYFLLTRLKNEAAARQCIQAIFLTMDLLAVDNKTTYEAFHCSEPDFEDGIIRMCAELNKMDYIVTRDKDAFLDAKVKKVDPAEMLAILG